MPSATARCSSSRTRWASLWAVVAMLAGAQLSAQEVNPVLAFPIDSGRETRESVKASPSSTLDSTSALIAASTIASQIPGGTVMTVLPTGSMRPMFDEKAYLVMEPASFESLEVGDVITFRHPKLGVPVVHRVFEKRGESLWTKGDHNPRPDDVYVTSANYRMRVVAVIYAREGRNSVAQTGTIRSAMALN